MTSSSAKTVEGIHRSSDRHWVGDGFPVRSVFGYNDLGQELSPFLLLDHAGPIVFRPGEGHRGIKPRPHKGFESVTIVYSGEVAYRDSFGRSGIAGAGDVRWMTAGSGIVQEECRSSEFRRRGGELELVEIWVNLRACDKSADSGYQLLPAREIPTVELPDFAGTMRLIAGSCSGIQAPARTFSRVNVWDLALNPASSAYLEFDDGDRAAIFVLGGSVFVNGAGASASDLVVLSRDGSVTRIDSTSAAKLLILSGEPLDEPVVGYGPFVMNSEEEVRQAFAEFGPRRIANLA